MTIIGGMADYRYLIFEVFQRFLSKYIIFAHEIFFGGKFFQGLALDIKSLIIIAFVTLEI